MYHSQYFNDAFLEQQKRVLQLKLNECRRNSKTARGNIQIQEKFSDPADEANFMHEQALALKELGDSAETLSRVMM